MTIRNQAQQLLQDPLLPLSALAETWGVTTRFLRAEGKRNKLKILKLSPRVMRVRASEARRYETEWAA